MNRLLNCLLLALVGCGFTLPACSADDTGVGVLLMHGKWAQYPDRVTGGLASALQSNGFVVSSPEMPWSSGRKYDVPYERALQEIDREVENLRRKGAKTIIVAGMSMGANATFAYASSRPLIDGFIAIAPAHNPESPVIQSRLGDSVARAKELVGGGRGGEKGSFTDINMGKTSPVRTSAESYWSYFSPEGIAVMKKRAAAIQRPVPFLVVLGSQDQLSQRNADLAASLPPHPGTKVVTVNADHLGVPDAAVEPVLAWLKGLAR